MEEFVHTFPFGQGYTIKVNQQGKFVSHLNDDQLAVHDTKEKAETYLVNRMEREAKAKEPKRPVIRLQVLMETRFAGKTTVKSHTLTRVHAGTGNTIIGGEQHGGYNEVFYPQHPTIVEKFARMAELNQQIDDIEAGLRFFEIKARRAREVGNVAEVEEALIAEYNEKLAKLNA